MSKTAKIPYKVTPSSDNKKVTILLYGNLSIDKIDPIKEMLKQNLAKYSKFLIKLEDVESIDLGMIQLLYSFKWSVAQQSKSATFFFDLSEDHKLLLEHAGYTEFINENQ